VQVNQHPFTRSSKLVMRNRLPFARYNPKPQVSGTTDIIAAKIMMLLGAGVPDRPQPQWISLRER
jgi:hypothetical protein